MSEYSIADAKNGLPQLVRQVEAGYDIQLTRRGKPVAMLVSTERYRQLTSGRTRFSTAYEDFRRDHELAELDLDPDEVYGEIRDRSAGRDFAW